MIKELKFDDNFLWNKFYSSFCNYDRKKVDSELKNNPFIHYLIYQKDNKIVGFLNYSIIYDRIEINQLEVLEEYRKKHIGSLLIEELISIMDNNHYENITLEVRCDNIPAIELYRKYDFKKKAIRRGYYDGIDGILMEKEMIK